MLSLVLQFLTSLVLDRPRGLMSATGINSTICSDIDYKEMHCILTRTHGVNRGDIYLNLYDLRNICNLI